ncbi:hypothetical protein [Flavisericum labens]|uniref:hypothetical protein n=1 Tax=Flavisericum labens TaxID=3377112 RepID=UPI00387A8612
MGGVKEEALKPPLVKYIYRIPSEKVSESYKDNSIDWISDQIDKDIYLAMEDLKATINIIYKK